MTPWQRAKQWQDEHDPTKDFWELVGEHLSSGLVFNTEDCFLLARKCHWNKEDKQLELTGDHNCWFVTLAAGTSGTNPVRECLRVAPQPLKYAAWCRRGSFEPRVYLWEKLIQKTKG